MCVHVRGLVCPQLQGVSGELVPLFSTGFPSDLLVFLLRSLSLLLVHSLSASLAQPGPRLPSASPSSGLEDEVGVGSAFRVLVAGTALPVGVGWSRTLGQRLHHLCDMERKKEVQSEN